MDLFYTIVLTVAIIVLILILTIVGITLGSTNNSQSFPPSKNTCPDYWTVSNNASDPSGTCIIDSRNMGSITKNNNVYSFPQNTKGVISSSDGRINFTDSAWESSYMRSNQCALYQWTNNNKISWDGVSNFNGC